MKYALGKRIRMCREAKGWNQEDLAEAVGLSVTYIGMIERGDKTPKLSTFINITNVLSTSADWLLADLLDNGYNVRANMLSKKMENLEPDDRERILEVIETMLNHKKRY